MTQSLVIVPGRAGMRPSTPYAMAWITPPRPQRGPTSMLHIRHPSCHEEQAPQHTRTTSTHTCLCCVMPATQLFTHTSTHLGGLCSQRCQCQHAFGLVVLLLLQLSPACNGCCCSCCRSNTHNHMTCVCRQALQVGKSPPAHPWGLSWHVCGIAELGHRYAWLRLEQQH
jgi:hypothetical protein